MKYKLVIILFLTGLSCYSQSKVWELNLDGVSTTKAVFAYPSIGFNINKIKIQSGVLIGDSFVNQGIVFGAHADLLIFPNEKRNENFNFFFIGSLNYFHDKVELNFSEVKTNYIQMTIGYGFTHSLSERIYLKSSLGLGGILENRKFSFNSSDPNNKWGFAGIISLGLSYRL